MHDETLKPEAILCKSCKKITLLADCIEHSMMCKACHYAPRKPTQMGPMEMRQKIAAGKLSPAVAEKVLETRKLNAKKKQAEAVRKRWAKERGALWDDMINLRNAERRKAKAAYDYAVNPKNGYRKYDAEFYAEYMNVLDRIGEELRRKQRNGAPVDIADWEELVTQEEQKELRRLWSAIPIDLTARGRKRRDPAILDTTTRIEGGYTDEDYGIEASTSASATPPTEDTAEKTIDPYDNSEWDIDLSKPE